MEKVLEQDFRSRVIRRRSVLSQGVLSKRVCRMVTNRVREVSDDKLQLEGQRPEPLRRRLSRVPLSWSGVPVCGVAITAQALDNLGVAGQRECRGQGGSPRFPGSRSG